MWMNAPVEMVLSLQRPPSQGARKLYMYAMPKPCIGDPRIILGPRIAANANLPNAA